MSLSDYLKCPGLDRTLSTVPEDFQCPECEKSVEIWSDEVKRRCGGCGTMVFNPNPMVTVPETHTADRAVTDTDKLKELVELAVAMGCDDAAIVPAEKILVDPQLAGLCLETRCQNYGLSPTCPPNVEGPEWMKDYLKGASYALFLKIEVDDETLYSDKRLEIGKLLHFLVIQIEKAAHQMGLDGSRAFAGGSCKRLFCPEHYYCEVLEGDGICRNPDSARPSVSGYGIHIKHLIEIAEWSPKNTAKEGPNTGNKRYGLVILQS